MLAGVRALPGCPALRNSRYTFCLSDGVAGSRRKVVLTVPVRLNRSEDIAQQSEDTRLACDDFCGRVIVNCTFPVVSDFPFH